MFAQATLVARYHAHGEHDYTTYQENCAFSVFVGDAVTTSSVLLYGWILTRRAPLLFWRYALPTPSSPVGLFAITLQPHCCGICNSVITTVFNAFLRRGGLPHSHSQAWFFNFPATYPSIPHRFFPGDGTVAPVPVLNMVACPHTTLPLPCLPYLAWCCLSSTTTFPSCAGQTRYYLPSHHHLPLSPGAFYGGNFVVRVFFLLPRYRKIHVVAFGGQAHT